MVTWVFRTGGTLVGSASSINFVGAQSVSESGGTVSVTIAEGVSLGLAIITWAANKYL